MSSFRVLIEMMEARNIVGKFLLHVVGFDFVEQSRDVFLATGFRVRVKSKRASDFSQPPAVVDCFGDLDVDGNDLRYFRAASKATVSEVADHDELLEPLLFCAGAT